ncbi:MAG: hypothetical protein KIT83_20820 [Bryobacterales bacterium]|nr:hypothetical protein [Bryobacterales bacterium]
MRYKTKHFHCTLLFARPFVVHVPPAGVLSFAAIDFNILDDSDFEWEETVALARTLVGPATLSGSEHVVIIRNSEGLNECVAAQMEVQEPVGDHRKARYRNNGMQMKLINETLKAMETRDEELPEGCQGCIVIQFARGILVADQMECTYGIAGP